VAVVLRQVAVVLAVARMVQTEQRILVVVAVVRAHQVQVKVETVGQDL
jgi:hypothetical protein